MHTDQLDRFLWYPPEQHPIVLQLGGSDPESLAAATRKAVEYGYDEVGGGEGRGGAPASMPCHAHVLCTHVDSCPPTHTRTHSDQPQLRLPERPGGRQRLLRRHSHAAASAGGGLHEGHGGGVGRHACVRQVQVREENPPPVSQSLEHALDLALVLALVPVCSLVAARRAVTLGWADSACCSLLPSSHSLARSLHVQAGRGRQ